MDASVAPNLPTIEDSMLNRTDRVHTLSSAQNSRLFPGVFLFVCLIQLCWDSLPGLNKY